MKVNNEIYEKHGHKWWDDDAGFELSSLRYCVNPVRYGYFKRNLEQLSLPGKAVLDVGCGGGFLSEEFAGDGFAVTGIDPSGRSLEAARKHAAQSGLAIDYRIGRGEDLPFPDGSFDIVACCDVLEHVDDLCKTIGEVSRVLKTGGVFFFDTVNRTWFSWFVLIVIWQKWRFTRFLEPDVHVWEKFIKPAELAAVMENVDLDTREMKGISVEKRNPAALLWNLRSIRSGRIRNEELTEKMRLCETDDMNLSYMGLALKQ
jgi:2-polyprenyl-6-hydroxyphenyl methylase / 3-demethylubiquinone-9 3-methyltransferase